MSERVSYQKMIEELCREADVNFREYAGRLEEREADLDITDAAELIAAIERKLLAHGAAAAVVVARNFGIPDGADAQNFGEVIAESAFKKDGHAAVKGEIARLNEKLKVVGE